jgi:hypothetical protein
MSGINEVLCEFLLSSVHRLRPSEEMLDSSHTLRSAYRSPAPETWQTEIKPGYGEVESKVRFPLPHTLGGDEILTKIGTKIGRSRRILLAPQRNASIYRTSFELERPRMALQVLSLFLLALPIASIAWTITHEEVVREFRDVCLGKSTTCRRIYERKFFYLFTCEYCFSHYVAAVFLLITRFKLLYPDWRGYLIAGFSLVWVANVYMSLFARIRLEVKRERVQIKKEEEGVQ